MSDRMLSDSEMETLDRLKKKVRFQNSLIRNIENSMSHFSNDKPKERQKSVKNWFLNESAYWKKKKLTECEFERAWQLLLRKIDKRIQARKKGRGFY